MTTYKLNTKELFSSLNETYFQLSNLISSADSVTINLVPFKGSWTAAQLVSHVTKSNKAIRQSLRMEGKIVNRNPEERIQELKAIFLNFTTKFNSPEFIVPNENVYQKETIIKDLKKSIDQLKETGNSVNLSEMINLPAFGEITKLELIYFVFYHMQRHIYQLKNILKKLNDKI